MSLKNYSRLFHWILGIFSFFICLFPKLVPIAIILLVITVVLGLKLKYVKVKLYALFIVLILFYFAYLAGILFSLDTVLGFKYAEYKLAFLLLPLVFSIQPKFKISIKLPALGLAIAIIIASIVGFSNAFHCYESYPYLLPCFTSSNISPIHHPSYFSVYILVGVFAIWDGFKNDKRRLIKSLLVFYTVFSCVMYVLCFSLAGFLCLIFLGAIFSFLWLKQKVKLFFASLITLTIPMILFLIANFTAGLGDEINVTAKSVKEYIVDSDSFLEKKAQQPEINGNETRLIMWIVSVELIKEYPFGAGTGSLDIIIKDKLQSYGLNDFASKNYNPHNQFLQTTLEIGFLGLFLLIAIFYLGISFAMQYRSKLLFVLVFAFLINSFFESMFQRQSGIIFYSFWISLIIIWIKDEAKDEENV